MGTTLDYEIDDIANGGEDFGWVKTYTLLPEGRAGSRREENGEEKNEPGSIVFPYVNGVLEGGDEGHEEEAQGKSLEKRGQQEKGSNTNFSNGMVTIYILLNQSILACDIISPSHRSTKKHTTTF